MRLRQGGDPASRRLYQKRAHQYVGMLELPHDGDLLLELLTSNAAVRPVLVEGQVWVAGLAVRGAWDLKRALQALTAGTVAGLNADSFQKYVVHTASSGKPCWILRQCSRYLSTSRAQGHQALQHMQRHLHRQLSCSHKNTAHLDQARGELVLPSQQLLQRHLCVPPLGLVHLQQSLVSHAGQKYSELTTMQAPPVRLGLVKKHQLVRGLHAGVQVSLSKVSQCSACMASWMAASLTTCDMITGPR